jgi:hypothetical protein
VIRSVSSLTGSLRFGMNADIFPSDDAVKILQSFSFLVRDFSVASDGISCSVVGSFDNTSFSSTIVSVR